jgi:hypothetical protein
MVTPGHVCTNCGKFNPLPAAPAQSQRSKQVPERTISDECKYCAEGEPEWSTDASCWIHRRPQLDKRCTRKTLSPIGELPAPSQPAAREAEAFVTKFARERHVKFPDTWDFIYELLDAFLAQQTAAKDAEWRAEKREKLEWMSSASKAMKEKETLLEKNCKLQDDVASIVSSHRSDWSWDDVLSEVRALKTNSGRVCSIVQALRDYYAKQPIFEPYVLQELGRVLAQLEAK